MNHTTRRFPRSMREAFGSYATTLVDAAGSERGQDLADAILIWMGVVILAALLAIGLLGYFFPAYLPAFL